MFIGWGSGESYCVAMAARISDHFWSVREFTGGGMKPCCEDFGRYYNSDQREPGIHIRRLVREPPHYNPPRCFRLSFRPPEGTGCGVQICFCPFCGKDLNALWTEQMR